MKFDTFYKWITGISFCDPMMGSHVRIYEIYPNDFKNGAISINFGLSDASKLKAYLIAVNEKLNDDEQIKAFNDKILLKNKAKYNLILNNIDENKNIIEAQEDSIGLIYDYLPQNHYQINIQPNDNNNLDKYFYLKIQTDKPLNKEKDINNGFLEFHPDYPSYYPISTFYNGNDSGDGDNRGEYTHKMSSTDDIEKIVLYMLNIFEILFQKNVDKKYYDYHLIERPLYNSIYNNSSYYEIKNGKILFPNLYIHYINVKEGFYAMIINKYNFKYDCESTIKYLSDSKEYHLDFKVGTFILNSDLKISHVEDSSNKLFSSIKYELKDKSLKDVAEQIIEKPQLLSSYYKIIGNVEENNRGDGIYHEDFNISKDDVSASRCKFCGMVNCPFKDQFK